MHRLVAVGSSLALLGIGSASFASQARASSPGAASVCTAGKWVSENPNLPAGETGALLAAAIVSKTEAWAVGNYHQGSSVTGSLIERWNGSTWAPFGSGAGKNVALASVISFGASHAFAAGEVDSGFVSGHALVTVFNGSKWTSTTFTDVAGSSFNRFTSISGSSASEVSAVGTYAVGSSAHALLEHWNGSRWTRSALPGDPTGANPTVLDLSPTDVWLLGPGGLWHFNGSAWSVFAHQPPNQNLGTLVGKSELRSLDAHVHEQRGLRHTLERQHLDRERRGCESRCHRRGRRVESLERG